jgi:nucleotide-binding universal stress UspA family protein
MYQHILIATDGSDLSQKAIECGLGSNSEVVDVYARPVVFGQEDIDKMRVAAQDNERSEEEEVASHILSRAESLAVDTGVSVKTIERTASSPAVAITDAAIDLGCDLIVMGSHGRSGIKKLILGSQADKALQLSKVPVLVVK